MRLTGLCLAASFLRRGSLWLKQNVWRNSATCHRGACLLRCTRHPCPTPTTGTAAGRWPVDPV